MGVPTGLFQGGANRRHSRVEADKDRAFRSDEASKAFNRDLGMSVLKSVMGIGADVASQAYGDHLKKPSEGRMDDGWTEPVSIPGPGKIESGFGDASDSRAARRGIDMAGVAPVTPAAPAAAPVPKAAPTTLASSLGAAVPRSKIGEQAVAAIGGPPTPMKIADPFAGAPNRTARPEDIADPLASNPYVWNPVTGSFDAPDDSGPATQPTTERRGPEDTEAMARALGVTPPKRGEPVPEPVRPDSYAPPTISEGPATIAPRKRPTHGDEALSWDVREARYLDLQAKRGAIADAQAKNEIAKANAASLSEYRIAVARGKELKAQADAAAARENALSTRMTAVGNVSKATEPKFSAKGKQLNAPAYKPVISNDPSGFHDVQFGAPDAVRRGGGTGGTGGGSPSGPSDVIDLVIYDETGHGDPKTGLARKQYASPTEAIVHAAKRPGWHGLKTAADQAEFYRLIAAKDGPAALALLKDRNARMVPADATITDTIGVSPAEQAKVATAEVEKKTRAADGDTRTAEAAAIEFRKSALALREKLGSLQPLTTKQIQDAVLGAGATKKVTGPDGAILSRVEANAALAGDEMPAGVRGAGTGLYSALKAKGMELRQTRLKEIKDRRTAAWGATAPNLAIHAKRAGGLLTPEDINMIPEEYRKALAPVRAPGIFGGAPGPAEPPPPQPGDESAADPLDELFQKFEAMDWPASKKRRAFLAAAERLA